MDIIFDVLKIALESYPESTFLNSLMLQYQKRGSLSKKQLEGLHSKASKVNNISFGKLATLEAIILKKPTRYKSTITVPPVIEEDDLSKKLVEEILTKYPTHKRVQFFNLKLGREERLSPVEKSELEKFHHYCFK